MGDDPVLLQLAHDTVTAIDAEDQAGTTAFDLGKLRGDDASHAFNDVIHGDDEIRGPRPGDRHCPEACKACAFKLDPVRYVRRERSPRDLHPARVDLLEFGL